MGRKWRMLWLALILGLLAGCDVPTKVPMPTAHNKIQTVREPAVTLSFPYSVPESMLIVEALQNFSGPYWEDGSGEYVENVAALMVFNPTDRMVDFATLAVEQEGETLHFFLHALPPQSRCLVLEYTGKRGEPQEAVSCRELCVRWGCQEFSREQIDYLGLGTSMTVINRDGRLINRVRLCYKQYVKDGDYYLGGAVQTTHIFSLEPDERRTVTPEHYNAGCARIVSITLEI